MKVDIKKYLHKIGKFLVSKSVMGILLGSFITASISLCTFRSQVKNSEKLAAYNIQMEEVKQICDASANLIALTGSSFFEDVKYHVYRGDSLKALDLVSKRFDDLNEAIIGYNIAIRIHKGTYNRTMNRISDYTNILVGRYVSELMLVQNVCQFYSKLNGVNLYNQLKYMANEDETQHMILNECVALNGIVNFSGVSLLAFICNWSPEECDYQEPIDRRLLLFTGNAMSEYKDSIQLALIGSVTNK